MKAKAVGKRGGSWTGAFLGDTEWAGWGLSEERGCYKHLHVLLRETRQTAEEVREQEMSTELGTSRSMVESRDKNKDSEVAGGCCFPLTLSLHIRHMFQGECLGEAKLISSLVRLTHTTQVSGLIKELRYTVLFSVFNPSELPFLYSSLYRSEPFLCHPMS